MKKITLLLLLSSLSHLGFSQLIWSYDFKNDTIGKSIVNRNGWSGKTDKGFPGGGECVGASCEPFLVKSDTLEYPNYGSFYKALDLHRNAAGLGHFFTSKNELPDTSYNPTYKDGDKVYVSYLIKPKTAPQGNDGQPSIGQVIRINAGAFSVGMRLTITRKTVSDSVFRFGVEKNGGAKFSDYKYPFNKTHLIVMRYTYKDSINMNDEVALFINPKLNAPEPTPDFVTTTGPDLFLKGFLIYGNNFTDIATGSLSGIKVYQKWNDVVSTTSEVRNEMLSIKPTLAEDFIELNLEKSYPSVSNIVVVDLQGREVLTGKLSLGETRKVLNINSLAKGFYVVSIQNKDFIATQKFVKN